MSLSAVNSPAIPHHDWQERRHHGNQDDAQVKIITSPHVILAAFLREFSFAARFPQLVLISVFAIPTALYCHFFGCLFLLICLFCWLMLHLSRRTLLSWVKYHLWTLIKFLTQNTTDSTHPSLQSLHVSFSQTTKNPKFVSFFKSQRVLRPVHPPYSSVFVTEFNPEYGNTDLLIWLRRRSSPKYGNAHHLNIFFTVISCVKNVAPSVGNVHVPLYYARCQATCNIP